TSSYPPVAPGSPRRPAGRAEAPRDLPGVRPPGREKARPISGRAFGRYPAGPSDALSGTRNAFPALVLLAVLLAALARDGGRARGGGLRVQVLARAHRAQVLVQLVAQRDAGGDVQPRDVLVGDLVEVLDQRPQRIAVRGHQHRPARQQLLGDGRLPVGHHPVHYVEQALGARDVDAGVARVAFLAVLVAVLDRRRRGVVAAPPQHELLVAVLVADLRLVLALQLAVVALVEPPVTDHRDPVPVGRVQRDVGRGDGAAQQRGEDNVRQDAVLGEQLTGALALGDALVGEVHVHP